MIEGVILHLLLLVVFVGIASVASAAEIALVSLSPSQIHRIVKQDPRHGRLLMFWENDPDRVLITIAILNNVGNIAASAIAVTVFILIFPYITLESAATISSFLTTLVVLICGEITPKLLGKRYSVAISLASIGPLVFLSKFLSPVSAVVWWVSRGILRTLGRENREVHPVGFGREEIKAHLDLVKTEGVLTERENKMLKSILHLREIKVKDIMVNRMDMVCLELGTDYARVLQRVRESGYSRIPVYEGEVEHIKGVLMAKDILSCWDQKSFKLASLIRPAVFVPEMISLDQAMREFINRQIHLGIVVNEYGEVEGLVSLEDVIEEILGEIEDEFDTESVLIKQARKEAKSVP
jgi:putative hemolysin